MNTNAESVLTPEERHTAWLTRATVAAVTLPWMQYHTRDMPFFGLCSRQMHQRIRAAAVLVDKYSGHSGRKGVAAANPQVRNAHLGAQRTQGSGIQPGRARSVSRGNAAVQTLEVLAHAGYLCPQRKSPAKCRGQAVGGIARAGTVSESASWHSFVPNNS